MTQRTIWGFEVETSPKRKKVWSLDPKREGVRRVLEDDQHIGTIAAENEPYEYLVRIWSIAARRERGETIVAPIRVDHTRPDTSIGLEATCAPYISC